MVWDPVAVGIRVAPGVVPTDGTSNGKIYVFPDRIADDPDADVEFIGLLHMDLSG